MIYVTGDMHGDLKKLKAAAARLKKNDYLIVAGDFGFIWNDSKKEKNILKKIGSKKYTICFIDGANENHDILASLPQTDFCGGKAAETAKNLWYLQRGEVYEIEGKKIFVFGGAKSEDAEAKRQFGNWFERELPNEAEMTRGVENLERYDCEVDYIVTHEPPASILASLESRNIECDNLQIYLEQVIRRVKFSLWVFGRLHRDKRVTARVVSVFCDVIPLNPPSREKRKERASDE